MLTINVRSNVRDVVERMGRLSRQEANLAAAKALTFTAQADQRAEIDEMRRVFDRPTPYALNGTRIKSATPSSLTASVFLKDESFKGTPAERFLGPEVEGGPRRQKRFEKALISAGLMPSDMFAVPGAKCPLDQYGNISGPFLVQLLSALGAHSEVGYLANRTVRSRKRSRTPAEYFVGRPGGGRAPLGVWQRVGRAVYPILVFVKAPNYKQRFDFYGVAERTTEQQLGPITEREMKAAIDRTLGPE